jgi:hypothetical protein
MTKVPDLDLHGVKHEDAMMIVEEWAMLWSYRVPAFTGKIITGNSTKMRTLAESALKVYNFDYKILKDNTIIVAGKL